MDAFGVVIAGGGGTRFWPLSRRDKPKQFLEIIENKVMINETLHRINKFIDYDNIYIVTNINQRETLERVIVDRVNFSNILYEPEARNTSACIGFAALTIKKRYGDGIMCVFPADHYIKDEGEFSDTLEKCIQIAGNNEQLVTVGIKPTFPATGYGYIKYNNLNKATEDGEVFKVSEFVEKPSYNKAQEYVENGNYLWNSGIFVWKASVILESFRRFLPRVYDKLIELYDYIDDNDKEDKIEEIYKNIPSISIDYGIMERADNVVVIPGNFQWSDVGSLNSMESVLFRDEQGNSIQAKHIGIRTNNSIIYSKNVDRIIATIGIEDLIVADTDDALLICRKDMDQDVKHIVENLQTSNMEKYL